MHSVSLLSHYQSNWYSLLYYSASCLPSGDLLYTGDSILEASNCIICCQLHAGSLPRCPSCSRTLSCLLVWKERHAKQCWGSPNRLRRSPLGLLVNLELFCFELRRDCKWFLDGFALSEHLEANSQHFLGRIARNSSCSCTSFASQLSKSLAKLYSTNCCN